MLKENGTYLGHRLGNNRWNEIAGLHVACVTHLRESSSIVNDDSCWFDRRAHHYSSKLIDIRECQISVFRTDLPVV